ncbi:hypothetical protein ACEPAH_2958 [Sanghuangporus vaninii]
MYKLLRRISSSFKGRFDWKQEGTEEDGSASSSTASTPQTGSKRRMSDDDDNVPNGSFTKRSRGHTREDERVDELGATRLHNNESETSTPVPDGDDPSAPPGLPRKDTECVRHVTKGVKEVELEDKKEKGKERESAGEEEEEDEKEEDAKEAELTAEKSDDDASSEEAETNETTEAKHVADAEPVVDEATKYPELEPSKDETPIKATVSSDPQEESSERIPKPVDTPVNAESNTQATEPPTNNEAAVPTPTIEPFAKLPSDEGTVKVQG